MVYVPFILDRSTGQIMIGHKFEGPQNPEKPEKTEKTEESVSKFKKKRNQISSTISNASTSKSTARNSKNSARNPAFENIFRRNYIKLSPFKPRKVSSISEPFNPLANPGNKIQSARFLSIRLKFWTLCRSGQTAMTVIF